MGINKSMILIHASFIKKGKIFNIKHPGTSPSYLHALTTRLATYTRYVDDTFTAVHKDGIDDFHEHLNRQNADIQVTKEIRKKTVRYLF